MEKDFKLTAQGLARDYAGRRVVHAFDLRLAAGEVLGLLGPNGAGKTTTLRMLAGTLAPSAGQISIAGHALAGAPRRAKRHLGYLPEHPPLYSELTVNEYLGFCARLHGIARSARNSALASAKADCGLDDSGRRLIGNLSKGFQQRVGIAQAILHRPDVVILDEPTAGLDPNQLRGVRELIARLAREHSLIISSHILPEIQAVASRVIVLHQGHVVFDAPLNAAEHETQVIEIGLTRGPDTATLAGLAGVAAARSTGPGLWQLTASTDRDIRTDIAREAIERDWGLVELRVRPVSLEERFSALTSRDVADSSRPAGAA